jgi:hypothetical protein
VSPCAGSIAAISFQNAPIRIPPTNRNTAQTMIFGANVSPTARQEDALSGREKSSWPVSG